MMNPCSYGRLLVVGVIAFCLSLSISANESAADDVELQEGASTTNKLATMYKTTKVVSKKLKDQFVEGLPETALVDLELDRVKKEKPNKFHSWSERADYIERTIDATYNDSLTRIDRHYGSELDQKELEKIERSSLRFSPEVMFERNDGIKGEWNLDIDAVVALPRLEKKLNLFVQSASLDELSEADPGEEENDLLVGISRKSSKKYLDLIDHSVGIKIKWPPVVFWKSEIKKTWMVKGWAITPKQRFYWESDEGFGEVTSLRLQKWIDKKVVFRSSTGVRLSEVSEGAEWDQNFSFLRIIESLTKGSRRSDILYSYRAVEGRFSLFGHYDNGHTMDRYRVQIRYRQPLYKHWVFLNLTPELNWRDQNGWQTDPGIRVGVELVFGNYYSRFQ